MVLGYHLIFGAYGFWLPNDPRGSWSSFVGAWELFRFGPATKTETRHSVARQSHDWKLRQQAKQALKYAPVVFDGIQARAVGRGFAESVDRGGIVIWACSILPEHVHLVIARHDYKAERIATCLKGEATRKLIQEEIHPFLERKTPEGRDPKCWARGEWKVFVDSPEDVVRAIRYVEDNPLKEGKPRQRWPFVASYEPAATV